MEVTGGSGPKAWKIRYGTGELYSKKLATTEGNIAWLSHGGWLRRIDTEKGVVSGRWHFPGSIVHLTPVAGGVQVQLQEKEGDRVYTQLVTFNPESVTPIPYWPAGQLFLNRLPVTEVEYMWGTPAKNGVLSQGWQLTADQDAKQLISTLEESSRRDPFDPFIRVALWRVLRQTKDPRAEGVLNEALSIETADFTELLPIASLLELSDEPDSAKRAFEAGYRSFLDRGNDPRLNSALLGKVILYSTSYFKLPDYSTEHGRELMERHFRLAPYSESADLAWLAYANIMESHGRAEDAKMWRERSDEASYTSLFLLPRRVALFSDILLVVISAALLAAALFAVLLDIRYRPQRRADAAANPKRGLIARFLGAFSFQHWSFAQRIAFVSMALIAWVSVGIEVGILRGVIRVAATPISMATGSLAGPAAKDYLEHQVPATPERDLMLAFAQQQSGRADLAEKLYRSLPAFAESWNNLGVIFRAKGNDQEAKQAFEKALQVDPELEEAASNLGRTPHGLWAEQYAQYFPGRPMLAPPRPQRVSTALFGSSLKGICLRGLEGPFADLKSLGATFALSGTGSADAPAGDFFIAVILAIFVLAVVILFIPSRTVTEAPPRAFLVAEILFPGVARNWSLLGGLALLAWAYFLEQMFLVVKVGTPYLLTSIAQPGLTRTYNVPPGLGEGLLRLYNPGWGWVYGAPLGLFVLNLALVLLARRKADGAGSGSR